MPRTLRPNSETVNPSNTIQPEQILRALAVRRRCGTRHERGVYVEAAPARVNGTMDARCLFDPPLTLDEVGAPNWYQPHRTPITFEHNGVTHFAVWVGEEYYPCVHDFIEEVRAANASRKLPPNFDFSRVTEQSRMFFVHPRARVHLETQNSEGEWVPVISDWQNYTRLEHALYDAEATERDDENPTPYRRLPCDHVYAVRDVPEGYRVAAEPGLFMQLPITGIALVNDREGAFPENVEARVRQSRVPVFRTNQ